MTKDKNLHCQRKVFNDPRTGREVWQVTDWDADQMTAYMYAQAFSKDERYLVFQSDRGERQALYRLELETGAVIELSDEAGSSKSMNMHPDGEEVYYVDVAQRGLRAANVYTLQRRLVAAIDRPDWKKIAGTPGFSGDGRKVCCSFHTEDKRGGVAVAECAGAPFEEAFRREEDIQHVQFCPGPGYLISFAVSPDYQNQKDRPRADRARAWKLDCETRKAEPFLVMPPGFRATHEFWNRQGTRLFFHKKTVPQWIPNWVCSIDVNGGDFREHFRSDTRRLGHSCLSRDNAWLASDSQDPGENEIVLVNLKTGVSEVLCWPNASIAINKHIHPSFSPSGTKILYTSDASGKMQIFIVPLKM